MLSILGAMAEKLGSGLQNRLHRCESDSRLHSFLAKREPTSARAKRASEEDSPPKADAVPFSLLTEGESC